MKASLPKIVLVDDEKDNLEALKRLLRKDYEIEAFLSAEEALDFFRKNRPKVEAVVSDQRMPGLSGSEFFGKLLEINPSPTRILLTGFADLEAIIDAVNRGHIWRYVSKPWEPEELKLTLKQAVERTHLQNSLKDSNLQLERALQGLKAKDWSQERLLNILLHEFRTIPQILEGVQELDKGSEANTEDSRKSRESFLSGLKSRVNNLALEIESLFEDEKRLSELAQESFLLSELLALTAPDDEMPLAGPKSEIALCLKTLEAALAKNSESAVATRNLDFAPGSKGGTLFLSYVLKSGNPILPEAFAGQKLAPATAWPALLEPFVGLENFHHHGTGLRLDFSRKIRNLNRLGIKTEFKIQDDGRLIELLLSFPIQ